MIRSIRSVTLASALAAALVAPAAAQERPRPELDVVVVGPGKVEMALALRRELGLSEQQLRQLEEIRADAERRAAGVLNAQQNQRLDRRQERLRALREQGPAGPGEEACERSEDGSRMECRSVRVLRREIGPGAHPDATREFEVCERPSGTEPSEEKCRTVRVRGDMGPMGSMMLFGHPGMMPGMRRMPSPPGERERCTTDAEGRERCDVVIPMDTTGADCRRDTDEQGRERVTCRREVNRRRGVI